LTPRAGHIAPSADEFDRVGRRLHAKIGAMALPIRRVAADQWRELRALRLEALEAAPDAFGEPFAEAAQRPDDYWQAKASRDALSPASALFVALDPWRERLVGMAGAYIADTDDEIAWIFSVYVTPAYRGTAGGVGEPVMNATVEWLRGTGVQAVRLKVYQDNARAVALYRLFESLSVPGEASLSG
jgi:ribosomal protein S18 acetylase RimI-like enzyme